MEVLKMTNIIREMKEIDADITLWYRNSKLPKFIKKLSAKNKRRKLHNVINEIKDMDSIPIGLLYEYITILNDTYPPYGRYGSCSKITVDNDGMLATFLTRIDEKRIAISMINLPKDFVKGIIVRYTYMVEGKTKFSYGDSIRYTQTLSRDNNVGNDITKSNMSTQKQIIKNICVDAIHDDIVCFLKEIIERSERVYKV